MSRDGGDIQPGAQKYSQAASFPATPAVNSMPEWYPELFASVTRQVSTGRSKAMVKSLPEEFNASLPSIRELEAELSQDIPE